MIYIVEDDVSIRELVVYTLGQTGFDAVGFSSASELFAASKLQAPQLIILDIMLGGMDGLMILQELKAMDQFAKIPVIMATAKGSEFDKVTGLELGADDYLVKPFGMMELVARVKAILRRTARQEVKQQPLLVNGMITLDKQGHTVKVDTTEVHVTTKEFALLELLMEHIGKVLSRDQILSSIWGYDFDGESRTVDVHVKTLRTKLGVAGAQILTVRGVGYKMED